MGPSLVRRKYLVSTIFIVFFLRIAEEEAPNLKPKCHYNKHYMRRKMKKKKRRKVAQFTEKSNSAVLRNPFRDIEVPIKEGTKIKTSIVDTLALKVVKCQKENCKKKFSSESALQYHLSFAHANFPQQRKDTNIIHCKEYKTNSNHKPDTNDKSNEKVLIEKDLIYKTTEKKEEKVKKFSSIQNIRPIVPAQAPQLACLSGRPIQPKPMLLPGISATMNMGNKKSSEVTNDINYKTLSPITQKHKNSTNSKDELRNLKNYSLQHSKEREHTGCKDEVSFHRFNKSKVSHRMELGPDKKVETLLNTRTNQYSSDKIFMKEFQKETKGGDTNVIILPESASVTSSYLTSSQSVSSFQKMFASKQDHS